MPIRPILTFTTFYCCLLFATLLPAQKQYEADFSNIIADCLGGQQEVPVTNGRVDILTETLAIEVEWASKWKQAIGQALWYAQQTNRQPVIILLLKNKDDWKYSVQLQTTLNYAGLSERVQVQLYPNDFEHCTHLAASIPKVNPPSDYWLNANSNKRHNSNCAYFERTNGTYCDAKDGIACKRCGG
jgi:hypothetical protein